MATKTDDTIPIENGNQVGILISSAISIFIVALAVALRLVAKRMANGLDYSDYCILGALFFNTALHTDVMVMVTHGGFGFHTMDIIMRFGPDTATFFFKGIMAFAMLWNATVCFSKISVLLMYCALIPVSSMVKWARGIGIFIIAWNIANIMACFLICRPLRRNWDLTVPGTCGSQPNFYFAMGIINILTDIALIVLPMPYIYNLRMPMKKKLIAAAMLSIGIMTWVITIYRQTFLPTLDFADMTYSGVLATILSGLEPAIAIVLACIPLMRPLLGQRKAKKTGTGYDYGSGSGSGVYSKGARSNSRPFTELEDDDADTNSEVRLQPMKGAQDVNIVAFPDEDSIARPTPTAPRGLDSHAITVQKRWEVRTD